MRNSTSPWQRRFARVAALACVIIALDTTWVIGLRIWAAAVSQTPQASNIDGIAVLYADFGPELDRTRRSLDGARALRVASGTPILCIGGNRQASGQRWGRAMTRYLQDQGVAPEAIIEDHASYDTRTNVRAILEILRSRELHSIAIVAHPAHAPRVLHHWHRHADAETAVIVLPPPPRSTTASIADFWLTAQHEALAWLGLLLPDAWEDRIIRSIRR